MRARFFSMLVVIVAAACGSAGPGGTGQDTTSGTLKIADIEREVIEGTGSDQGDYALAWRGTGEKAPAPISLTASDGTGLEMVSLTAKAAISDPLAFTELHIVFHNPEDRVREGRFEIALPPGAALSRFAMMIDGKWQEAEVVEKQAARRAYEDFLHRNQDPALMEKKAGNQFRARVFPIPANADKEFIVSFSQELRGASDPYVMMLRGLPALRSLNVDVMVKSHHLLLNKNNFKPERDLEVIIPRSKASLAVRNQDLVVARVTPRIGRCQGSCRIKFHHAASFWDRFFGLRTTLSTESQFLV